MEQTIGLEVELVLSGAGAGLDWGGMRRAVAGHFPGISTALGGLGIDGREGSPFERTWGIGPDGLDVVEGKPVLEVRTGIYPAAEVAGLLAGLSAVRAYVLSNPSIRWGGQVGIHVHVGNDRLATRDPFTRLSMVDRLDETLIYNRMRRYNRRFEIFGRLHSPRAVGVQVQGFGDHFLASLDQAMTSDGVISNTVLAGCFGVERDWGVNVNSRQPTIEYRQLATGLLMDDEAGLATWCDYFLAHTATQAVLDTFSLPGHNPRETVSLTRVPLGTRVEYLAHGHP